MSIRATNQDFSMRHLPTIILALAAVGCSSPIQRIECPVAETGKVAGSLQETPVQIKAASDGLGNGDENQISRVAANIRARHPDASEVQIVDYLVTAYCPKINANQTMSKAGKQQAMKGFASRVERIVGLAGRTS
jgi:hypothetical protein